MSEMKNSIPEILKLMSDPKFAKEVLDSGFQFDSKAIFKSLYDLMGIVNQDIIYAVHYKGVKGTKYAIYFPDWEVWTGEYNLSLTLEDAERMAKALSYLHPTIEFRVVKYNSIKD